MIVTKFGKLQAEDHIHVQCPRCRTRALLSDDDVMQSAAGIVKYKCPLCEHVVQSSTAPPALRFAQSAAAGVLCFTVFIFPLLVVLIFR